MPLGEMLDRTDPMTPPGPDLQRLAATYVATHVTIEVEGLTLLANEAVTRLGAPLYVLTAWNPGDARPGLQANRAANARLLAELQALAVPVWPALGSDPQGTHAEESYAVVGLPLELACKLGRNYSQVAVFELEPGVQRVVACDGSWSVERAL